MSREDANARRDDVPGEVGNEKEVAEEQVVFVNKSLEVGAGEDGDHAPCTIKVGGDGIFMAPLGVGKVDAAKFGGSGGWGDVEHHMIVGLGALGRGGIVSGILEVKRPRQRQ